MALMDRDEQFKKLEDVYTWYDEIINNYEAAFWIHYRILNYQVEKWIESVMLEKQDMRVKYFIHTEYMSVVYAELLLTIENLFKGELFRANTNIDLITHKLVPLLDEMSNIDDDRCNKISQLFIGCRSMLQISDDDKYFVNLRYIDYNHPVLDSGTASEIKMILEVLDKVYFSFYADFCISRLLYLGVDFNEDDDLTEDERKRLKRIRTLTS